MGRKRELSELGKRGPGKKAKIQPPPEIFSQGILSIVYGLYTCFYGCHNVDE